jgi:hypothetical protein
MKLRDGGAELPVLTVLSMAHRLWLKPNRTVTLETRGGAFFEAVPTSDDWVTVYTTYAGGGWMENTPNLHPNYGKQYVRDDGWKGWALLQEEVDRIPRIRVQGDELHIKAVVEKDFGGDPISITYPDPMASRMIAVNSEPMKVEVIFELDLENLPDPEDLLANLGEYGFAGVYCRVCLAFMTVSEAVTVMSLQRREVPGVNVREQMFESWINRAEDFLPPWFEEFRRTSERWANQVASGFEAPTNSVYDIVKNHLDGHRLRLTTELDKIDKFSADAAPFIHQVEFIDDLYGEFNEIFGDDRIYVEPTKLEQAIGILEDVLTKDASTPTGADLALVTKAIKLLQGLDLTVDNKPPFDIE